MTTRLSSGALRRTLGFTDLVMLTLGTVIGSGIFLVPAIVLRQTGERFGLAMAVWAVGGVVSFLGALTYAELGAANPEAGGLYSYIRDAFGPLPAFLYGWTSFLVIASGSCAALAVAFSNYLSQIVPLGPVEARVVSVVLIALVAAINVVGARRSSTVENWATGAKVGALLALSLVLVAIGRGSSSAESAVASNTSTMSLLTGAGAAMIGVLWAYEGWQYVTFAAGETRNPQRVFPRAIAGATAALIVLYVLANLGYVAALGVHGAAASDHVAGDAMRAAFGSASGAALVVLVLVSIFSAANGITLGAPRMYYAMARDGVFFTRLARVNPRFGTPTAAILLYAVWSALLAVTGTFQQLLTYVVFAGWIFYALGALSVFGSRRRYPERPRPFLTPFYPVTPALFAIAAALLVANTLATQTREALVGLAVVALGIPAFFAWRMRMRRHPLTVEPPPTELTDASTVS